MRIRLTGLTLAFATLLLTTLFVEQAAVMQPASSTGGNLLFESSWENTTELGCSARALLDTVWEDYGGSGACNGTVHDADIVDDVAHGGRRSLRVTQKPGKDGAEIYNGTDFRIQKKFGEQTDVTLVGWLRYDASYRWAKADHKIFIFADDALRAQNVYINFRGGSDNAHARLCAAATPVDAVFCSGNPQVTTNTWYRLRVHVVSGAHGKIEMWLQPDGQAETKLNLKHDAGSQANINDLDVGSIASFKIDTTYNAGSGIAQNMYQWYDAIAVYSGLAN
jgi:hypothetical protein